MIEHPYENIEAYALGGLQAEEAERLLQHADGCPSCAALLADALNAAVTLEAPGERTISRVNFNTLNALQIPTRASPTALWMAFIATAAAIGLLIWNVNLRANTLTVPVALLVHSHFQHHELRGSIGSVKVMQSLDGSWLYLVGDGLTPRSTFSLSEVVADEERQVGTFVTNARGQATAYWEQPPAKIQGLYVRPAGSGAKGATQLSWP
jgi:hypothetical protein